ncbi:hypothetical protein QYF36_022183 [Acer negundo]|nr:hypothetical protein QYF36_022183 [Acer negundo]
MPHASKKQKGKSVSARSKVPQQVDAMGWHKFVTTVNQINERLVHEIYVAMDLKEFEKGTSIKVKGVDEASLRPVAPGKRQRRDDAACAAEEADVATEKDLGSVSVRDHRLAWVDELTEDSYLSASERRDGVGPSSEHDG